MSKKTAVNLIAIVLIIVIVGVVIWSIFNRLYRDGQVADNEQLKGAKTLELFNKILEAKEMSFTKILDDSNKVFIVIKDDMAYKEITINGNVQKYVVKDGDTYYLDEINQKYYIYKSNDTIITEVKEQFEGLYNKSFLEGKEKIDGKNYSYEEVSEYQDFLFNYELAVNDLELAKTKFYFDGGKLAYIKTVVGDYEELLKIDVSLKNVKDDYFNIPENYLNGDE